MEKGGKIKDIRDNSIHVVNCVDVYDTVTLVFTEDKKYIPIDFVGEVDMYDEFKEVLTDNPEIIREHLNETVIEPFKEYFKKLNEEFRVSKEKGIPLFNLKENEENEDN